LVQQLSFELGTSTSLKLEWLRESLMSISSRKLAAAMGAHVPAVLEGLRQALDEHKGTLESEDELQHETRLLRFVVNSVEQQFI
jgi:hypothetical protein